jgi:ribonuclease P protein subunit POP4
MPLTPETLTRHELNGLPVAVVDSPNPDLVGIAGRVVVETMRTLHVDTGATGPRHAGDDEAGEADGESRVRQVPKEGTTFEFRLPATATATATATETTSTTDDRHADDASPVAAAGRHDTDEAAGAAKAPGTASEPVSDPEEPATDLDSTDENEAGTARAEAGEGVAYVTVDGTRLLSRPALRTENAGETTWR